LKIILDRVGPPDSDKLRKEIPEGAIGGHDAFGPSLSDLLDKLQTMKENFDGSDDFEMAIQLPDMVAHLHIPERGITNGKMLFTA
jgi:hypothetical protein